MPQRPRILIALSDASEASAVADWLVIDGFEPVRRSAPHVAAEDLRARQFDLLIADAAFVAHTAASARRHPLVPTVLVGDGDTAPNHAGAGKQILYLRRPIDPSMLACFVSMALLDDRPVRRSARKPVNRFEAVVNGVRSHLVDVSPEGLRLELPRDRRAALPPYFTVRVPLVGVAINVQRMWTRSASGAAAVMWYGAALAQNRAVTEQAWRSFVSTIPAAGENRIQVQS